MLPCPLVGQHCAAPGTPKQMFVPHNCFSALRLAGSQTRAGTGKYQNLSFAVNGIQQQILLAAETCFGNSPCFFHCLTGFSIGDLKAKGCYR